MESLALVVAVIVLVAVLGGPIAVGITFISTGALFTLLVKRIIVTIFASASILMSSILALFAGVGGAKRIAIFSFIVSFYALSRIYGPQRGNLGSN